MAGTASTPEERARIREKSLKQHGLREQFTSSRAHDHQGVRNVPLQECAVCHSAWPRSEYRMSNGGHSKVCRECAKANLAEGKHHNVNSRSGTASVKNLRSRRQARVRGKTKIYRAGEQPP